MVAVAACGLVCAGCGGGGSASGPSGGAGEGGGGAGGTSSPGSGGNAGEGPAGGAGGAGASGEAAPHYLKASNTGAGDFFGVSLAFSADGKWLAVGANREASASTGVNGDADDDSASDAGAVYLFSRDGDTLEQVAYVKASNTGAGDAFGSAVALAADGSTLVVGAPFEASAARGVDGDQDDDSAPDSGAVYVFVRRGNDLSQEAYLKASNGDEDDVFGAALALSADGNRLVVGADGEDGSSFGVDGDQTVKGARESGAVYVFERSDGQWSQTAYLKASNTDARDHFGGAVALSADGHTLAVGAYFEDSAGTSIADQEDDSAESAGAVYVFVHGGSWQQAAYLKPAQNDGAGYDAFGGAVALSANGSVLAVGAAGDDSAATGIDGDSSDRSSPYSGAAHLFVRAGTSFEQEAYIKPSVVGANHEFGHHLALSADGGTLAVGAAQAPNSANAPEAGAVTLFRREGRGVVERARLEAFNASAGDRFGWSLAFAGDASLAIGANREGSASTALAPDPADDSAPRAGAVYIYDGAWFGTQR